MATSPEIRGALQRAVDLFGSEQRLARACGVTQSAISKAKLGGKVSVELAKSIHRVTRGQIPASVLRPDLWSSPQHVPIERRVSNGKQRTTRR